jgi:transcriptional regulator with XRE-family HTH domain
MERHDRDNRYDRLRGLLIAARKAKGLTQIDLATRLRQTQIWVSRYEKGRRGVDVIEFLDIARAIGVNPCRLLRKISQ